MKSSRLPMILLPVLLLGLVWLFPVRMMRASTAKNNEKATAANEAVAMQKATLARAEKAKADEATLNADLAKIRQVLPTQASGVLSPIIISIADLAARSNVKVTSQAQTNPLPAVASDDSANGSGAASTPAASGTDGTAPIAYTVSVTATGSMRNIIKFTSELPSAQRLFLDSISFAPDGDSKTMSMDSPVKATMQIKTYVDSTAKATVDPPAKSAG